MENWDSGFIGKTFLTRKLIDEKLPVKINLPLFHHSMCEAKILASIKSLVFNKLYKFRDVT